MNRRKLKYIKKQVFVFCIFAATSPVAAEETSAKLPSGSSFSEYFVSLGFSHQWAYQTKDIGFGYRFSDRFAIEAKINYASLDNRNEASDYSLPGTFSCYFDPCTVYKKKQKLTGQVSFDYNPFQGNFFITGMIGKYPDVNIEVILHARPYSLYKSSSHGKETSLSYTINAWSNYYFGAGIGWNWKPFTQSFIRISTGFAPKINRNSNLYVYSDNRGLINPEVAPSYSQILYYQHMAEESTDNSAYLFINISAGIYLF